MKAFNQVRHAIELITGYKGKEALNLYLKNEFKKRPQFGSNDRRLMRELCIAYYKIGLAIPATEFEKRIAIGYFLNNKSSHAVIDWLMEEQGLSVLLPLMDAGWEEKKNALEGIIDFKTIYPFESEMMPEMLDGNFLENFYQKPLTWLRLKPKAMEKWTDFLHQQSLEPLKSPDFPYAFGFSEQINIAGWPSAINSAVEVQDLSSQLSLKDIKIETRKKVWDCCAASGGKSLLLYSLNTGIELYVSDIRKNIIKNLEERFSTAGIGNSYKAVTDMSQPLREIIFENKKERKRAQAAYFDYILVDAPCSGSGTWRRNPERMLFVDDAEIKTYISLQQSIVRNALTFLKPGGTLIYLTCSLYTSENSNQLKHFLEHEPLELIESKLINCMAEGGDVMFQAIFKKKK